MDAVAKINNIDSLKGIPIRELVSGNFSRIDRRLKSKKKSLLGLEGQRRILSQQILQTQKLIEQLNNEVISSENDEEKMMKTNKIAELKESLSMNARALRDYDAKIASAQAEVSQMEADREKVEKVKEEIITTSLNAATPGAGYVYKYRYLIIGLTVFGVFVIFAIIFSLIKATDSPGATIETIINTQCADATDPNCVSKFIENSVDNQFENRQ